MYRNVNGQLQDLAGPEVFTSIQPSQLSRSVEELQKMATLAAFIKLLRQVAQYPMEDDIDDQCARESHECFAFQEAFQEFQQEFLDQAGY